MARWFRSEPMDYISLIVNEDAAHDCLADLGNLGVIQFTDVSSSPPDFFKNAFVFDVFSPLESYS
jgi:vacuolar-type H+-ATPase subunit I/STV1